MLQVDYFRVLVALAGKAIPPRESCGCGSAEVAGPTKEGHKGGRIDSNSTCAAIGTHARPRREAGGHEDEKYHEREAEAT